MEQKNIARFPLPCRGRIPNFVGSEKAAIHLRSLKEYQEANVAFCNPDAPQRPCRKNLLEDGKILIMPPPRLRQKGFIVLNPSTIPEKFYHKASTIKGAFQFGELVSPERLEKINIKIMGSVAVDKNGGRVGKSGGYSDLEVAILYELDLINNNTPLITTVHEIQILDKVPMTVHDANLDIIVTPKRIIRTNATKKLSGIIWSELDDVKIQKIPLLQTLKNAMGTKMANEI